MLNASKNGFNCQYLALNMNLGIYFNFYKYCLSCILFFVTEFT